MPSTNKLHGVKNYSNHKNRLFGLLTQRKRDSKSFLRTKEHVAQQLLFLCGIITSFVVVGTFGNAYADSQVSGSSSIITVNLTEGLAVRTLDSTAANAIESLDLELTPTPTGSFNKDTSIIDVATSNPSGYNLYMTSMGKDHNNNYTSSLVHSDSTISDVIATLPVSGVTESAFSSPSTTASPNPYVDKWGYSLTELDTAGTYNAIPVYGDTATLRSDVKTATESSMTPVTIGVNTDTSILSGTYSNTLLFTAAANPPYVGYTLNFNANAGSSTVTNMPNPVTSTVMATSAALTIPSTIPERSGYAFLGWSPKASYTPGTNVGLCSNTGTAGSGTDGLYVAGDKCTIIAEDMSDLSDVKASLTLYAVWIQYNYSITYNCNSGSNCPANHTAATGDNPYTYTIPSTTPTRTNYNFKGYLGSDGTTYQPGDTVTLTPSSPSVTLTAQWEQSAPAFFTITYMQDMTPSVCSSATTPATSATTSDTTGAYDKDTSYVPETTLIDYRGTDGTGTANSPATGSNKRTYTVRRLADGNCWMAENLKLTLTNNKAIRVGTFSGGETSWTPTGDGAGDDFNEAINANTKANVNGGNWYYPWYAATAGQGTQTASPTISQSICPKGWKLPNGGSNTAPSFQSIVDTYSATTPDKIKAAPLSYTAVGDYYSGSRLNMSNGFYWSASPYTSNSIAAYNLDFDTSSVYPQDYRNKSRGFSVRCVAIP